MDIWYFFVCNGLDLLKENGLLGYIAPNNWTTNSGASKMRNKVVRDSQIIEMIDFGNYMVFQDASIQTMNFILKKSNKNPNYGLLYGKLKNQDVTISSVIELLNHKKTIDTVMI